MKITTQHAKTLLDVANAVLKGKIYSCKCYLAIRKDEVLIPITTWMNLENMLSERSQSLKTTYCMTPFI